MQARRHDKLPDGRKTEVANQFHSRANTNTRVPCGLRDVPRLYLEASRYALLM